MPRPAAVHSPMRRRARVLAALVLAACGHPPPIGAVPASAPRSAAPGKIAAVPTVSPSAATPIVVRFAACSSARSAFKGAVLPGFVRQRARTGLAVEFEETYCGSEALTRAIEDGLEADIVVLALQPEYERLARAGLVRPAAAERPFAGIVSRSLVVLAVRKGNPLQIQGWADLVRPGVRVVLPDSRSSGAGLWDLCGAYGAALRGHAGVPATAEGARGYVRELLAHVVDAGPSASASFRTFASGVGDVAVTYESEVLLAWQFGGTEELVVPASTIVIENPAAVVDRNAEQHGVRALAGEVLAWFWSPDGQRALASRGLRPVDPAVRREFAGRFLEPADAFSIEALGGWDAAWREVQALVAAPAAAAPR